MTALCHGRNRPGWGTANGETARVAAVFRDFAALHGRAPGVPELVAALADRRIAVTPERVRVHLHLAGLRAAADTSGVPHGGGAG